MRHTVRIGYQLYRHFSATGELLYVGISLGAILRLRQHRAHSSPWILDVARIEIQTYPSRAEAAAAEREAIKTEKPKYNQTYNKPPKPRYTPKNLAAVNLMRAIFEKGPLDAFGEELADV